MTEDIDLSALQASIREIRNTQLSEQSLTAERRKVDDARFISINSKLDEHGDRLNTHGTRTTKLEVLWEAFTPSFSKSLTSLEEKHDVMATSLGRIAAVASFIKWAVPIAVAIATGMCGAFVWAFGHGLHS